MHTSFTCSHQLLKQAVSIRKQDYSIYTLLNLPLTDLLMDDANILE